MRHRTSIFGRVRWSVTLPFDNPSVAPISLLGFVVKTRRSVSIQGTTQASISEVMQRHHFVDLFLNDVTLDALIDDLENARNASGEVESDYRRNLVQVCEAFLAHPFYLQGANQVNQRDFMRSILSVLVKCMYKVQKKGF